MEHNFLTEQTRKFLKTAVNDFSVKDQLYTDEKFFKKSQEEKLKGASTIYFSFPQNLPDKKLKKQHTEIYNYWNFINKKINDSEFIKNYDLAGESINPKEKKVNWVNLIYPETIDVNYSDYRNEKFFKSNLFVKEYKDGLMAVSQEAKSKDLVKIILGPSQNESFNDVIFSIGESLIFNESFYNFGDIDWNDKKFDNLILYFVAPKINKNKAVKIILKDNKYWNQLIQKHRENKLQKISSSELLFFREKNINIELTAFHFIG